MNKRGPQTSDVQRARSELRKAQRALGTEPTPRQLKEVRKLAEGLVVVMAEARRRAEGTPRRRRAAPPLGVAREAAGSAVEWRARLAGLAEVKGHAHFVAERRLRRDFEAAVALIGSAAAGASLDTMIGVLALDELVRSW